MVTHISNSPEETFRLGQELGRSIKPGDVIGLIGDLGAGKTQFVKGLANALQITERIHSPTFALVNEYRSGRLPCYHLDLYRLDTIEQIIGAGLDQCLLQRDGVTVVEWFDRWLAPEPTVNSPQLTLVRIESTGDTTRKLTYEHTGA